MGSLRLRYEPMDTARQHVGERCTERSRVVPEQLPQRVGAVFQFLAARAQAGAVRELGKGPHKFLQGALEERQSLVVLGILGRGHAAPLPDHRMGDVQSHHPAAVALDEVERVYRGAAAKVQHDRTRVESAHLSEPLRLPLLRVLEAGRRMFEVAKADISIHAPHLQVRGQLLVIEPDHIRGGSLRYARSGVVTRRPLLFQVCHRLLPVHGPSEPPSPRLA
mmetsp:Transcript_62397/g.182324  ORF Transcript_62397/g.182324 Transcript_62397/m.182324 type:complete len:221 (-) Transcript_62397:1860-2522(-)